MSVIKLSFEDGIVQQHPFKIYMINASVYGTSYIALVSLEWSISFWIHAMETMTNTWDSCFHDKKTKQNWFSAKLSCWWSYIFSYMLKTRLQPLKLKYKILFPWKLHKQIIFVIGSNHRAKNHGWSMLLFLLYLITKTNGANSDTCC